MEPSSPGQDQVLVGTLGRAHGVDGWMVLNPESDEPGRFQPGSVLMTRLGDELTVRAARPGPKGSLILFHEVVDRSQAEQLQGSELYVSRSERRPLGEDEFWPEALIGLEARAIDGAILGVVTDVELGDTQDRIVVTNRGRSTHVPLVRALVTEVEVEKGYLVLDPIPGLFPQPDVTSSGTSAPSKLPSTGE
jgi:16S rRNA processing protein RimM